MCVCVCVCLYKAKIVAGRKCCEENLATFATFFPQQYSLSQFDFFRIPHPAPYSNPPSQPLSPRLLFFRICLR